MELVTEDGDGEEQGRGFGRKTLTLPNGTIIRLQEATWQSLRSAFVVSPWNDVHDWPVFSYGPSQEVPGKKALTATRVHTNIHRSGLAGLPMDWEMLVYRWRATINAVLEPTVLDWAAETAVNFWYNQKPYASATLADLLLSGARTIASDTGDLPVHMRNNLGFEVQVQTPNEKVLTKLRNWLRGNPSEAVQAALTELDTIARMQGGPVVAAIRHVQETLAAGRDLTCWIHLDGPVIRCVV